MQLYKAMRIAFIHHQQAFLPEIPAYQQYFSSKGITCEVIKPQELALLKPDVAWHFMGTDNQKKLPKQVVIHEYTSASVPPLAELKNLYKRWVNARPDYRLFLNQHVEQVFSFKDDVPYGFRDMGVPAAWLDNIPSPAKVYDFIYVGEWKHRGIHELLNVFTEGNLKNRMLLVVTRDYDDLLHQYRGYVNISFKGPLEHAHIRELICQSKFAINFMPDKNPFNQQTSTKLLEYAACRIPIITSDYEWVRSFQQQYGGRYFFLSDDLSGFAWENLQGFDFAFPDLSSWTWDQQIRRSGVNAFLENQFPGINLTAS
ncbi:MAG TPA: hypothetical protein VD993_02140 [Chitinophagaceae bacterium]|nr:hypothetical protein [Chitinophagaceae bacterium]